MAVYNFKSLHVFSLKVWGRNDLKRNQMKDSYTKNIFLTYEIHHMKFYHVHSMTLLTQTTTFFNIVSVPEITSSIYLNTFASTCIKLFFA